MINQTGIQAMKVIMNQGLVVEIVVSSNIIGNGHTLDHDSDLESCESDLEEEIQHDSDVSDAETIIDDSYVTNRPGPFNNNIDSWTYNLHDLPDIPFVNIDNHGVTDRQSVVKFLDCGNI